jgi:Protein of unknown function (DUF4245)
MADATASRQRGRQTVLDMVRSLGLVLVVVAVVVGLTIRTRGHSVNVVDYRSVLAEAVVGAPYELVAPVGLPSGWRPTSVYFDPAGTAGRAGVTSWHVGFVSPKDQYAAFEQTNEPAADMLSSVLLGPVLDSTTSLVDGVTWQRWDDARSNRRAIVRTQRGVTVVVDGSADWAELDQLAAALRANPVRQP